MASASSHSKSDHASQSFELRSHDIAEEPLKILLPISGFEQIDLLSLKEAVRPLTSLLPQIQDYAWIALQSCQNSGDDLIQNGSAAIFLYSME